MTFMFYFIIFYFKLKKADVIEPTKVEIETERIVFQVSGHTYTFKAENEPQIEFLLGII